MYKLSYDEIMDDDVRAARGREQVAFDRVIDMMSAAEAKGARSPEALDAIQHVQKLWVFFIENLKDPHNELANALKNDLVQIGIWAIAEADSILADPSKSFASLIDVNRAIRDGLK